MLKKIIVTCILLINFPAWAADTYSITTGFDYSSGKYGNAYATDIFYIPVTVKRQSDKLALKLTVPYISISSQGGVVPGIGKFGPPMSSKTTAAKTTTQSGLGDVSASAGYTVYDGVSAALDVLAKIKFGTADTNKNLGTGENDYSLQLDSFYALNSSTLFATAGYKMIGAPAGVTLNNIAYGSLGFSKKIGAASSTGMALDAAQASSDNNPETRELSVFVATKLGSTSRIQLHVMKGYTDNSPDFGGGAMITGYF